MQVCTHGCARTCVYVCIHVCTCARACMHQCVCMCGCVCACVSCEWVHVSMCVHMSVCMYVPACAWHTSHTHTQKEQSLCRNVSGEATLSSESTELSVRKPNLEHSSSRFFLSPIFPPWTSYDTVPSLGLFIHKPRVAIPAPSLRGSDEMTVGGSFVSQNTL